MASTITPQQKRELKANLHALRPVVIVGISGLTDAVLMEIERALDDHELIKIRLGDSHDHEAIEAIAAKICKATKSELVQTIGKIVAVYRKNIKSN